MSIARTTTNRPTPTIRLTRLLAAIAATAALAVVSTGHAAATTVEPQGGSAPPLLSGSGCVLVRQLITYNPSINKPRGDQQSPDHRHWDQNCVR